MSKSGKEVSTYLQILFSNPKTKPRLLLSDRGKEFVNQHVNYVSKSNEVFQIFSLPYTPLGMIERFGQTMKRKIRKALSKGLINKENFPQRFYQLLQDYNTTIHSTIGERPIMVHFTDQHIEKVKQRIKKIYDKQMRKAQTPLEVKQEVRVLVNRDPRLTAREQNNLKKKFQLDIKSLQCRIGQKIPSPFSITPSWIATVTLCMIFQITYL